MLFELEVGAKICSGRVKRKFDLGLGCVCDLKVHVALELHRFKAAFAHEGNGYLFLDNDVDAEYDVSHET